ncbi:type VI secretion system contractile sheath small subunit [Rhodospirillaceae bacterium KN72]|uniref:Type VI secretion system contractile sheath small subunit n=1 Tax=Pacificispira spongiicola TaxID=2729598 RepID=A0A7Y0E0R4_9PROT|nr:type VI secretion system contractile sheath small subunit [Pacificispira spongiicola]NMM44356.1 type VI secretion system contractile sheath small subunit [Pacificispira spongiicola]
MSDSIQHKIGRVRPPRVQITYDVEIGNAIQMKELPFVMGMIADLSGKPEQPLPKMKERKFVEIDRDNFNDILASIKPRLAFQVDNTMAGEDSEDGGKMNVELNFRSMEDFEPVQVVNQIEPLRKLYAARQRLTDLLTKLDGNDDLDALLRDMVSDADKQAEVKKLLEASKGDEE